MTTRIYVDRSRYESYGRCPRSRFLEYHFGGLGIVSMKKSLPLAVGGSVHVGLADMLDSLIGATAEQFDTMPRTIEEEGVKAALADFAQYDKSLELPDAEAAILNAVQPTTLTTQLMDSITSIAGGGVGAISGKTREEVVRDARSEMDEYLYREQSALVEALVRAYARRRLRPLLEQFEVLEVEREGEWKLGGGVICKSCGTHQDEHQREYDLDCRCGGEFHTEPELWFMSRPDALLRERESNQLYLLSYKTTGAWDIRKARDAEHDMQGMSEGVEIERRLGHAWEMLQKHNTERIPFVKPTGMSDEEAQEKGWLPDVSLPTAKYLLTLDAPPRILAVRYEYLLKGERWKDKELSERYGMEMRSQKSHLIRQYYARSVPAKGMAGFALGDVCWSWDYIREDGKDSNLAWQNWKSRPVWEGPGGVKAWIDALDDAAPTMSGEDSTMGLEPRLLGYKCDAQAVGVTKEHPLDAVFVPPVTVYRNEDELRDLVDQMESVERRIAEGVAVVDAAEDEGERRHALNAHFPQTRRACSYPTECVYAKICYGGEDIRRGPLQSGLYQIRVPNHPQERNLEAGAGNSKLRGEQSREN